MGKIPDRNSAFIALQNRPWFSKIYAKLTKAEINQCLIFIDQNTELPTDAFEQALNRMFLDKEKPRHWKEMSELLSCCNKG